MRAVVCAAFGPTRDLTITEIPPPRVGPGQAPGSEVSGIVRDVATDVTSIARGQRVVAFTGHGGFAMQAVAEAGMVYPIPDAMSHTEAAAFLVAYATSHHALVRRANMRPAQTVLVLGAAGGVGLAAVEISKRLGASVIAAASSDEKLALCKHYGAEHVVNYSREDLRARVHDITRGTGVDVVYDPVGGKLCDTALRTLSFLGRYLVVGFASGDIPAIPSNRLLLKSAGALGVAWGAFAQKFAQEAAADVRALAQWYADGNLRPHICAMYSLERCVEAMERLAEGGAMGKIVLVLDPDKLPAGAR